MIGSVIHFFVYLADADADADRVGTRLYACIKVKIVRDLGFCGYGGPYVMSDTLNALMYQELK